MQSNIPLFPESASSISGSVDQLYFFLVAVSAFFALLIFALVAYFAIRYRRREGRQARQIHGSTALELGWTIIPFILVMVMFGWGAGLYYRNSRAPLNATEIYVVGKQWMWKMQHPEGPREINELHVPVGVPIRLIMTSEDVIHSFYVPAFRIKQDALPGRYTSQWFRATKPGKYHLFCAEYCGTEHSGMIGSVYVMERAEYEEWLRSRAAEEPLSAAGKRLFDQLGCSGCHRERETSRGPALAGLFGTTAVMEDGRRVTVDEGYLRESIVNPRAKTVMGYEKVMPTYQGQVSEDDLVRLIAYIKSVQ
ncbi:MAG: cytochrome c oxidase subunit II [Acidobacteria bacterium]|nr:cytochrome c oxidase subunit II [Acidobacteriota bacterium]